MTAMPAVQHLALAGCQCSLSTSLDFKSELLGLNLVNTRSTWPSTPGRPGPERQLLAFDLLAGVTQAVSNVIPRSWETDVADGESGRRRSGKCCQPLPDLGDAAGVGHLPSSKTVCGPPEPAQDVVLRLGLLLQVVRALIAGEEDGRVDLVRGEPLQTRIILLELLPPTADLQHPRHGRHARLHDVHRGEHQDRDVAAENGGVGVSSCV